MSLSFSFIGYDIHASEEGGIYSYNQSGNKREFPFILSYYNDLQVQPLYVLPDSTFERGPDLKATGLTNPTVYIALYNSMGKLWYLRAQLQYEVASL